MSIGYVAIQWNRYKRMYDTILVAAIVLFLLAFVSIGSLIWRGRHGLSIEILLMRALGTCALLLLHVVLCMGPLVRLNPRLLPLLYNRRHLGVATFLVALMHGTLALGYYHGFGTVNPILSLFEHDADWSMFSSLPFQLLGFAALLILFVMAATSHDFWLRNLTPAMWKSLHMLVYLAYALVVMHVALGALQAERHPLYVILIGEGVVTVLTLHQAAGWRERSRDTKSTQLAAFGDQREEWIDAGAVEAYREGRGRIVCAPGRERIAVFKHQNAFSAVSNVCAHQGGPLGEGRIIDGCITCPWHGWQYRPQDGQSPPPFSEKIPTYRVRVVDGHVWIQPSPLPAGTPLEPAAIEEPVHA